MCDQTEKEDVNGPASIRCRSFVDKLFFYMHYTRNADVTFMCKCAADKSVTHTLSIEVASALHH